MGFFLAEKEGFEPSIPFWGIHDFQSCALGQLRDFSMRLLASCCLGDSSVVTQQDAPFVNRGYFIFLLIHRKGWMHRADSDRPAGTNCDSPVLPFRNGVSLLPTLPACRQSPPRSGGNAQCGKRSSNGSCNWEQAAPTGSDPVRTKLHPSPALVSYPCGKPCRYRYWKCAPRDKAFPSLECLSA